MDENQTKGSWCVLMHPVSRPPEPGVVDSLRANSLEVHVVTNAFGAMARLIVLSRERRARTGSLVFFAPQRIDLAGELARAVASYLPKVRCWQIQDDPRSLRPVSEDDVRHWRADPIQPEKPLIARRPHADVLRMGPVSGASPERTDPPSNLLTDAELDLLLAHDVNPQDPYDQAGEREDGRVDG